MSDILGVAASAAGGGFVGILGPVLGRVAAFFERRESHKHERDKWEHEVKLIELQQAARQAETEHEIHLAETAGSWQGLSASLAAEAAIAPSYPWVNAVRALTRPVLTALLWIIVALVFFNVAQSEQARIVETAVFAATAATLWWFGDRSSARMNGLNAN